jgi:hypothetical protein
MNAVIEEVDVKDVELGDLSNIGEDYNQEWKNRIERISFRRWKEGMERSEGSLEIYKRVVIAKGEMERWDMLEGEMRAWGRRFRGGLLAGKRRANWWHNNKCIFCDEEDGKIGHIILRCKEFDVKVMKEMVVWRVSKIIEESDEEEDKKKWKSINDEEKLWMTLGDGLLKWKEERLMKEIPRIWREEWERAIVGLEEGDIGPDVVYVDEGMACDDEDSNVNTDVEEEGDEEECGEGCSVE